MSLCLVFASNFSVTHYPHQEIRPINLEMCESVCASVCVSLHLIEATVHNYVVQYSAFFPLPGVGVCLSVFWLQALRVCVCVPSPV